MMNLRKSIVGAIGALLFLQALPASAQEQAWLKDRRYSEGMGYRVGDFELHPGMAGEFGYDSNMFLRASGEKPASVMRLRITPSLSIATLGAQRKEEGGATEAPPKVTFNASVAGAYNEYIAANSVAKDSGVDAYRNLGAVSSFKLGILPGRPVGAVLFGGLTRALQPSNLSDTNITFNRIIANAGGELVWAPGGGLFDWRVGYQYSTTVFEKTAFETLNNNTHTLQTRGRWRFLPRTALLFDASQSFNRYTDSTATSVLSDSDPLRARLGLSGLFSESVAFMGMFGWGSTFAKARNGIPLQNYDGPIAQAQLTFYPTAPQGVADSQREMSLTLSQIALGYTRDFASSYFGTFYTRDRGYLSTSYFFAGRVLVALDAGVSRVHFPSLYFAPVGAAAAVQRTGAFDETRIDGSFLVEYRVINSVGVNATVMYDQNASKRISTGGPTGSDDLSFKRAQAFVGLRWFM